MSDETDETPTPEMIEAGFKVLRDSGISEDILEADRLTVEDIYRAMVRARSQRARSCHP